MSYIRSRSRSRSQFPIDLIVGDGCKTFNMRVSGEGTNGAVPPYMIRTFQSTPSAAPGTISLLFFPPPPPPFPPSLPEQEPEQQTSSRRKEKEKTSDQILGVFFLLKNSLKIPPSKR